MVRKTGLSARDGSQKNLKQRPSIRLPNYDPELPATEGRRILGSKENAFHPLKSKTREKADLPRFPRPTLWPIFSGEAKSSIPLSEKTRFVQLQNAVWIPRFFFTEISYPRTNQQLDRASDSFGIPGQEGGFFITRHGSGKTWKKLMAGGCVEVSEKNYLSKSQ